MNIASRILRKSVLKQLLLKQHIPCFTAQKSYVNSVCKKDFEKYCDETLDSISEYFEEVAAMDETAQEFDVNLSSGVLTIHLSKAIGTYVINKQAPNKQIWLSSPVSGPKRYDFTNGTWQYVHDGKHLHELLEAEFSKHLSMDINLSHLPHYYKK